MANLEFSTKKDTFDFLENYATARKAEINQRQLGKGAGLLKSYMLETQSHAVDAKRNEGIRRLFRSTSWKLTEIEDGFYRVNYSDGFLGFLENVSDRHLALHTYQESNKTDTTVNN